MAQEVTGTEIALNTNENQSSELSKYGNDRDELLKSLLKNNPTQPVLLHIEHAGVVYQNAPPVSNCREEDSPDSDDEVESDVDTHDLKCTRRLQPTGQKQSNFLKRLGNSLFYLVQRDNTYGLQQKLKDYYEKLTVARVTWLDEERDKLIKDYYAKLEFEINGQSILLEEIFENKDGIFSTRVLIEGQPGYGKTTMANKIAYDWSIGEKYLQRFKICLLQSLRDLRNRSIEEGIEAIAENCEYDYISDVLDVIRNNSRCTLLILDGLDEMSTAAREDILKVLYGKQMFKEMTVLATSRTGLFNLKPEELRNLHGGVSMKSQFYEKKIRILGIVQDERQPFLKKFMSTDNVKSVTEQIENLTGPVAELFRSPLFLALLAIMIENERNLQEFRTKTLLYKNLTNFVIRRSSERNCVILPEDFDMFNPKLRHCKKYQMTFYQFGQQALKQLQNNDFQFECTEITYKIYEFGLLVNNKIALPFQSRRHFEPFHLSIAEFASAFYLWRDYMMNGFLFSEKNSKALKQIICQSGSSSLIPQFLVGLMGERVRDFFIQFHSIAYIISCHSSEFWDIINECHPKAEYLDVLSHYIPIVVFCSSYVDTLKNSSVVELGFKVNKFFLHVSQKFFDRNISGFDDFEPFEDFLDPTVDEEWSSVVPNVNFSYLQFKIDHFEDITSTFDKFVSTEAKIKIISIEETAKFTECVKKIENYNFKKILFGLRLYLTNNEYLLLFLKIILQKNVIENLEIIIPAQRDFSHFDLVCAFISISSQLVSLSVFNESKKEIIIDLNELTQNESKIWTMLRFRNIQLKCVREIINPSLILSFDVNNSGDDCDAVNALIKLSCKILQCRASLLYSTLTKCNSWPGYKSVFNLTILVDDNVNYNTFWSKLANFCYLETLQIKFCDNDLSLNLQELSLAQLKINLWSIVFLKYLKLSSSDQFLNFLSTLVNEKVYIDDTEKLFPKLMQVDFISANESLTKREPSDLFDLRIEIITLLLELLKMCLVNTLVFVFCQPTVINQIVEHNIFDTSLYQVEHKVYEYYECNESVKDFSESVKHSLMVTLIP